MSDECPRDRSGIVEPDVEAAEKIGADEVIGFQADLVRGSGYATPPPESSG